MLVTLGTYPTPVERIDLEVTTEPANPASLPAEIWVKRDDLCSRVYGGSKVRKLEPLLGEARRRGASRILTMGAAGSHHVLACSIFGAEAGLDVAAVLVPQPRTDHAVEDLRAALGAGLTAIASSRMGLPFRVLAAMAPGTYLIPLGGSNELGARAFVQAVNELLGQIARGELPEPDEIVVTLGSGGTAAGLLAGLGLAGSKIRVVAVAVSPPAGLLFAYVVRLAAKISGIRPEVLDAMMDRVTSELGAGYGHATVAGDRATATAAERGLTLDPTYTAKTFAAALTRARSGTTRVLYWHTLSSSSLESWLARGPTEAELPAELRRLFNG